MKYIINQKIVSLNMRGKRIEPDRKCMSCDSDKTFVDKNGHPCWNNHDGYWLCRNCYSIYVTNPIRSKTHYKKSAEKKRLHGLLFREKLILVDDNPRCGVCNLCRAVIPFDCKITHRHHEYYDEAKPFNGSMEICARCHAKQTWELGQVIAYPGKTRIKRADDGRLHPRMKVSISGNMVKKE